METLKLNSIVSMYKKPVLVSKNSKTRYMALSVDKSTLKDKVKYGLAREVYKRKGDPTKLHFLDKSRLIIVKSSDLLSWKKTGNLNIKGIDKVIKSIQKQNTEFIGLEDPDIYRNKLGRIHLFFTIAFKNKDKPGYLVFLGHAKGKSLKSLKATKPFLSPDIREDVKRIRGFKEISLFPLRKYALAETGTGLTGTKISLVRVKSLRKKFKHIKVVLDPSKLKYKWCNGELSTGPIINKKILNYKEMLVGFINGRERKVSKNKNGRFAIGLILINKRHKTIPWISHEPLIDDPKAKGITFMSDLVELNKNELMIYAHTDDSFVRAYKINLRGLENYLEKNVKIKL